MVLWFVCLFECKAAHSQLWVFQVHLKQNASRTKESVILLSANSKPSNSHSFSEDLTLLMLSKGSEGPLVNEAHSGLLLTFLIL